VSWSEAFASLSFWYGLGFNEIASMPSAALVSYLEQLPNMQAQLGLLIAEANSLPWKEASAQKQTLSRWARLARGGRKPEAQKPTPGKLAMIGIRMVTNGG